MDIKLWDHQKECVDKAKHLNYHALFMEAGVGKTAACVHILRDKYNHFKRLFPTIIIAPPVVLSNWKKEIVLHSKIKPDSIVILSGSRKERASMIRGSDINSIFISNYESFTMAEVFELFKSILKNAPSCLVLDECHRIKDIKAQRTKKAIELGDIASFRYLLSGTPILNNLMDIWSQFRVLDRGQRLGNNFYTFRAKFFEDKNKAMPKMRYFPNWKPIKGSDLKIRELIFPVSSFAKKEDCLTLPPLVKKIIEIEMSEEQKKLYMSMRDDLIATIETSEGAKHSVAELAITKALRLQQIVSGHIRVKGENGEEDKTINISKNPRKEALRDLLEDLVPYHKVLVWAVFHANYDDIRDVCKELKIKYAELHGQVGDRDFNIDSFNNDENVRVLIGHPGSGGIGVNLVAASYSIFYSRSFSLEFDIQAEARNYRGGSERHKSITRIDIVCLNTIDELVLKSLASKVVLSNNVLKEKIKEL